MSSVTDSHAPSDTSDGPEDAYGAAADAAEGRVYTVTGQDWDTIAAEQAERGDERIVVNMGPQHPSTHGVLRLILEMEGESVTDSPSISRISRRTPWVEGCCGPMFTTIRSSPRSACSETSESQS